MSSRTSGGLLVRVGSEGHFIPASIAARVAPPPLVTPVPGSPPELVGIALHEGMIVPVLALGPARGDMVVCTFAGDVVGLVGGDAFETGTFDVASASTDFVEHAGRRWTVLDVPAMCAAVQSAARRGPWAG